MEFPRYRARRMRANARVRELIGETRLSPSDFIYPLFVKEGHHIRDEVPSMPGVFQLSVDELPREMDALATAQVKSVMLFGLPSHKDELASSAYAETGVVQEAVRTIKAYDKTMHVATDVCLCAYTSHGHCGVIDAQGVVENDRSVALLAQMAISHARAGADMLAPSDMMDGRVGALRDALDDQGFETLPLMAYAAKYASGYYGPFRDAADSAPAFGDRSTYQMDPANSDEALREVALDIDEGADLVIVKPALAYLDIVRRVKDHFAFPTVAYNVSGEYAMVKAAALRGWIDERRVVLESLLSMKRAGACAIITYHAKDATRWLKEDGDGC